MKARAYRTVFLLFSVLFMVAAACSMPINNASTPTGAAQTQSVQTVDAMMTQVAAGGITATPDGQAATQAVPTVTLAAPTVAASFTPQPTATSVVYVPTTPPTTVCDQAGFIADISIPDGSVISAGTSFMKTWRLKNTGACTWTPDYAVVYDSGEAMSGPASQKIGVSVPPGQAVDVSVPLKAPGAPGQYRGNWRMRNAAGLLFGLGPAADRFYVDIKVVSAPADGAGYDFAANLCLAQWTGSGKNLPCLGKDGTADGFVLYQARPVLESGYVDDEPGLLTNPPLINDGVIRGKYPAYTVKANDRFLAIVSCEYNAKKCNARFQLDYQIDNGAIQTLGSWHEAYEGGMTTISVDLSALAGKNVQFILTVLANGASDQDRAIWLLPRIAQVSAPPTATFTATATITPTATVTPTPTITPTLESYPAP